MDRKKIQELADAAALKSAEDSRNRYKVTPKMNKPDNYTAIDWNSRDNINEAVGEAFKLTEEYD